MRNNPPERTPVEDNAASVVRILDGYIARPALAEQLGLSEKTIARYMLERNGLPSLRIGKRIYFKVSTVIEWLAAREHSPGPIPHSKPSAPRTIRSAME